MKKMVIFDLDGTLADTLESISSCMNRALGEHGFCAFPMEAYKKFVGNGARMLVARALRSAGDEEEKKENALPDDDGFFTRPRHLEEVFATYSDYFKEGCMYHVKPYDGICRLLGRLKEKGIMIAVFSNKPHENTIYVVDTLFGKGYFDIVQGQTSSLRKKPAPDGIFEIAKTAGLKEEDILYVGDSCVDMDTGKAARVETIGVLWGFREKEELLLHGADALIEKPVDLEQYL